MIKFVVNLCNKIILLRSYDGVGKLNPETDAYHNIQQQQHEQDPRQQHMRNPYGSQQLPRDFLRGHQQQQQHHPYYRLPPLQRQPQQLQEFAVEQQQQKSSSQQHGGAGCRSAGGQRQVSRVSIMSVFGICWGTETGESGEHYVSVRYLISWGTETGESGEHYVSVWDLIEPGPFCGRILHFFYRSRIQPYCTRNKFLSTGKLLS